MIATHIGQRGAAMSPISIGRTRRSATPLQLPDLSLEANTLFSLVRTQGITLETGIQHWVDPSRPTLGYEQLVTGDQPAYTDNWVNGDGSNFMSLNAATIAALNAYGGDDLSIVFVGKGDTSSPGNFISYLGLAEGTGVNHTFTLFRINSGLDLLSQCRRNTSGTTKAASITVDETTAVDVYSSVMPRNATMILRRGSTQSGTVDTVENLPVPTDFSAAYSHLFRWNASAGVLRYTGQCAAVLFYKGALSGAQLDTYKTDLQTLGII